MFQFSRNRPEARPPIDADHIVRFFGQCAYPHLAIHVASTSGTVVLLEGTCASYHSKQLAQNIASRCPGVQRVINNMKVVGPVG